jgi:hypothetical protein
MRIGKVHSDFQHVRTENTVRIVRVSWVSTLGNSGQVNTLKKQRVLAEFQNWHIGIQAFKPSSSQAFRLASEVKVCASSS